MSLYALTIRDVRCISHAELDIAPGLSLVWGDNGSGKTSLLEAIFLSVAADRFVQETPSA